MSMGMSMPPQQHGFPGYPGPRQMHPGMGGMNHPGISMDNRMMGINPPMMTNQGMSGHHGYGQGGYPWPRPYHWDDTVTPIPHEQSDSSVSPKSNISLWLHQNWNKQRHRQKKTMLILFTQENNVKVQTPSSGDNFRYVQSSFLAQEFFVSEWNEPVHYADTPPSMLLLHWSRKRKNKFILLI